MVEISQAKPTDAKKRREGRGEAQHFLARLCRLCTLYTLSLLSSHCGSLASSSLASKSML